MESPLLLILCIAFPVFMLFFFHYRRTLKNPPRPPGPRGLPIIGNLHQLDNSTLHLQLWQLAKKYGPLFSLKLGLRPAIVVSSPKLVQEVMKIQDSNFSGRPKLLGQQKLTYNGLDVSFSPYNEHWRESKKNYVVHFLSSKRVPCFSSIRQFEVKRMIEKIRSHASSSKVTNINEVLLSLTNSIICRITLGRRYEDEGSKWSRLQALFNELEIMLGTLFVSDYVPFSGWIDKLSGLEARLERNFKKLDEFYQQVIEEHMDPSRMTPKEKDILDILLELKKERSIDYVKAALMNILAGSTGTTTVTAVWAMTELIKNPRVMEKVQEEIRSLTGEKDFLDEDDIQKFSYLKAVIKETLRMHPPAPLLIPRETIKRCFIEGYEIPAKTLVYVNAWAIQRDPQTWKDPEEFLPERFLDSAIDLQGENFELIPFGAGRRMCPGVLMAFATLDLALANLLYSFDWDLPSGKKREDIDTEVLPGLTQHKKNPLCILAKCPT